MIYTLTYSKKDLKWLMKVHPVLRKRLKISCVRLGKLNRLSKPQFLHVKNGYNTAAKSLQSCPTLCDPIDGTPPGSPVPGILQARTLEWVAISFSNAWKWKVKVKSLSHIRFLATPWTLQPTRLLHPWDFPGKSTGVGCHCLLRLCG